MNEMCKVMEDLRNESYAEGREEQAKITAVRMGKKVRSPEEIAELIDFNVETVKKWLQTTEESKNKGMQSKSQSSSGMEIGASQDDAEKFNPNFGQ